jgi:hypothetical protein
VIIAAQPGNAQYLPAESVQQEFPVSLATQTVAFTPPANATIGQPVTLTATVSSFLAVTYASRTPSVCTVAGATLTPIAADSCTVVASQPGDTQYAPAESLPGFFPVGKISQVIAFIAPADAALGQPAALSATASSGLAVSYRTDTPAVCTVSGSAVSPATVGTCTVTASQPGNDDYAPAAGVTRSFPVRRSVSGGHTGKTAQAIAFAQPSAAAATRVVPLSATATSGLAVSFRSDTPSVCTVADAAATPIAAGTCGVTAFQAGDSRFAAARDVQRSFTVDATSVHGQNGHGQDGHGKISQAISFGQPQPAAVGQAVPLSASVTSGLALSFRSDTPSVCSVSGSTVTTTIAGTCTVTASQAGDDRYLPAPDTTESFPVIAGHQAQTITFRPPQQPKVGEAVSLTASATSGLLVAFRSDTPRICTVLGTTLTPIATGTCTVTASQGGSNRYAPARAIPKSFDVAPATSGFPGVLIFLLAAVVFAAAGVASVVRKVRRRSHHPPEPQPTISAEPVPGPPALVSVQNTGAGVRHIVRIESSPGASMTRIKEGRS